MVYDSPVKRTDNVSEGARKVSITGDYATVCAFPGWVHARPLLLSSDTKTRDDSDAAAASFPHLWKNLWKIAKN